MAGELSDHYPEVKEEKKPIVDKIPFDSVCEQFSCSSVDDANWMVPCYTDQTNCTFNQRKKDKQFGVIIDLKDRPIALIDLGLALNLIVGPLT